MGVAAAALLTGRLAAGGIPDLPTGCKLNYDYAGEQQGMPGSGIRASLANLRAPGVGQGHVAGWIGVGGPGLGPNGTDEWMQVGYAGFAGGKTQIYYEVTQPNVAPQYHLVAARVKPNAKNLMAVMEIRPNAWQAFVNNKPVSPLISLPESDGKFSPQAIGETWNAGTKICNAYSYGFDNVEVIAEPGGDWAAGTTGYRWQNKRQKLLPTAANSFVTRSTASATRKAAGATPDWEPPLIGDIVSSMLGHPVTTRCVPQSTAVTAQPDTILVSSKICSILVGFAVAEPRVPKPYSRAALQVATAALNFLRGIARASGTVFPDVDCGALTRFYQAMRPLGATSAQAAALRTYLLHASIPLYLPHCGVH